MSQLLRSVLLSLTAMVLLWVGGFLLFAAELPRQLPSGAQPAARTGVNDAIVVLTGGRGRLQVGLQLLAAGKGTKLLISGVQTGVPAAELQTNQTGAQTLFSCCVDLGYQARDTWGNAIEAALWMERNGYQSLHLVTASYHMPRSLLLFQQAMPKITLHANPVFSKHVKLADWWLFPGTMKLLAMEYSKYLISLLRVRLTGPAG